MHAQKGCSFDCIGLTFLPAPAHLLVCMHAPTSTHLLTWLSGYLAPEQFRKEHTVKSHFHFNHSQEIEAVITGKVGGIAEICGVWWFTIRHFKENYYRWLIIALWWLLNLWCSLPGYKMKGCLLWNTFGFSDFIAPGTLNAVRKETRKDFVFVLLLVNCNG